mgnify:CR=1 FL=1
MGESAPVARRVDAPAKVCELEVAVDADEDVLGLDVAVDYVLGVQVRERVGHLGDVLRARNEVVTSVSSLCTGALEPVKGGESRHAPDWRASR